MSSPRQATKLLAHERELLIELYLKWRIPVSQFKSRPEDAQSFVEEWNHVSQRNDALDNLMHYMRTQRKRGLWVRLHGEHSRTPPKEKFTAEETEILVDVYYSNVALLGYGSDALDHDDELAQLLTKIFAEETGRFMPAHQLKTKLTALRKRGLLPKTEKPSTDSMDGFDDIDKIAQ